MGSYFTAAANVFVHPVVLLSVALTAGRQLLFILLSVFPVPQSGLQTVGIFRVGSSKKRVRQVGVS